MNMLKHFFYLILVNTSIILGYAGPATDPAYISDVGAEAANVSLAGSEINITPGLKHAIQKGLSCATNSTYRDCWECCEKLGVEDQYMETCVGICEEIKLKNLRGY